MEFGEKLQQLRKQRGLTQEELAQMLYVSRTAVSKWESGRGWPNLESLKAISRFFSISLDTLLSGEELLAVAENEQRISADHTRDLIFGLLDCSMMTFWFLPLFGQMIGNDISATTLTALTTESAWLKYAYFAIVGITILAGVFMLVLQNCHASLWILLKRKLSLLLSAAGLCVFIVSRQPYAAVLLLAFLMIKVFVTIKQR